MTPREYVMQQRAEKPPPTIERDALSPEARQMAEQAGRSVEDLLEDLNDVARFDYAEYLLEQLSPRLPDSVRRIFDDDHGAVGAIGDTSPNAYMTHVDGGFAIIFHTGLRELLYRVARAFCTVMVPHGGQPAMPFAETARLISEILWWFMVTGHSFGPSNYPIERNQLRIAHLLATEAEMFILAHEIGHALIADRGHPPLDAHDEEHAADAYGMSFVLNLQSDERRDGFLFPLQVAGVEFALQIFRVLGILGLPFAASHPDAEQRVLVMRLLLREKCATEESWEAITRLADAVEDIFTDVVKLLENAGELEDFYRREADRLAAELTDLLQRCSGGAVPDYMTFYGEAPKIFNRGYPERLLALVAEVMARSFEIMKRKPRSEKGRKSQLIAFQQFKLLFGYVEQHMNDPARAIFQTAFADLR